MMPGLNDDAAVKLISRLGVDTTLAVKGIKDLAADFAKLNSEITKTEGRFKRTVGDMARLPVPTGMQGLVDQFGKPLKALSAEADNTKKHMHGMAQSVKEQLAAVEAQLLSTAAKAQKLGVSIPGLTSKVGEVRNLRNVDDSGQKLNADQKKALAAAQQFGNIQAQNLIALDKEIALKERGAQGDKLRHDAASRAQMAELKAREAVNRQWDEYLAKQKAAEQAAAKTQSEQLWAARAKQEEKAQRDLAARTKEEIRGWEQAESARIKQEAMRTKQAEALAAARAKEAAAAAQSLPNLQAQASLVQSRMRQEGIHDVQLKQRAETIRQELALLQNQLATIKQMTEAEKLYLVARTQSLKQQLQTLNADMSRTSADQRGTLQGGLGSMLSRRMQWFAAGLAFYGTQRVVSQGLADIGDIEMRMTQLGRIIEDPLFKMQEMRQEVFKLGQDFGFVFQPVQDIALRWAQAGYDVQDSLKMTRGSLLALNTAELNNEQATTGLIAIMKQWNMQAAQLVPTIDKINKVADDYAVSSQDIVDALVRSSGAAKNANMTMEQTIGLITAMKEASGRSGAEVGNALNSIVSFMAKGKFLETVEQSGIPAFADAAQQKLRPVFDVLADLSQNWDSLQEDVKANLVEQANGAGLFAEEMAQASGSLEEWTDLQKRDIMQTGAGIYRRNYLIALLKNFSQVYEVLKTQETALGYSQRENARTMETYQKKVEQLKAAWQELQYVVAERGGVLDSLKGLVGGLKEVALWFDQLPPGAQKAVVAIGEITLAIIALNAVAKFAGLNGLGATLTTLKDKVKDIRATVQAAGGIGPALAGIGPSLAFILPVAAALTALTIAIVKTNNEANRLQDNFAKTKRQMDDLVQSASAEAKMHAQNALQLTKLADEYRMLQAQRDKGLQEGAAPKSLSEVAAKQEEVVRRVEEALGRETTARLKAAGFSKEATGIVVKAERAKAEESNKAIQQQIEAYKQSLRAQMETALGSIQVIESQTNGWETYLTAMERVKVFFAEAIAWIKQGWYRLLSDITTVQAKLAAGVAWSFEKVGMDSWAKKYRQMERDRTAEAYNYSAEADYVIPKQLEAQIAEILQKTSGPLQRQRKLLTDLREELMKLSQGDDSDKRTAPGGEFGATAETDGIKAKTDAIIDQVEAMQAHAEATQSLVQVLKTRIDFNTREKATAEELAQADRDRAELLKLTAKRQTDLHEIAAVSRNAIDGLRSAQSKLNRTTDDGNKLWEELEGKINRLIKLSGTNANPIGDLSEQWWQLEKERTELLDQNNATSVVTIRMLKDLKAAYDKGLLPLNDYVTALGKLENQAGLTAEALQNLNQDQGAALNKQWTKGLEDGIEKGDKALKRFGDDLDAIFADAEKLGKKSDVSVMRNALRSTLTGLKPFTGASSPAPTNVLPDWKGTMPQSFKGAAQTATDFISQILSDKFAPSVESVLKLDRSAFAAAVSSAKDDLMKAGQSVNALLISLGNERETVIRSIEAQITPIQDVLQKFDVLDKTNTAKEARTNLLNSLGKLGNVQFKLPEMPAAANIKTFATNVMNGFKLESLGKLEPAAFAKALDSDLFYLRSASTTAKGWLEAVGQNFEQQLADIESRIRTIDANLKTTLADLQKQLDAMDAEEKQKEREKATKEHNERLKALQDQRTWYAIKGEEKYAFEIAGLDSQLAEEQRKWAETQSQWNRADKRQSLQDQMEAARLKADTEKAALETQKRTAEDQRNLLTDALNDFTTWVNGEIGGLKEVAQSRVNDLTTLKETTGEKYTTLLKAFGDVQQYVEDELGEWQRLSDERKRIEDDGWNNEKDGIRAIMNGGIIGLLADLAAQDPAFMARGQAIVDNLIAGINGRKAALQQAMAELNAALPGAAVPSPDKLEEAKSLAKGGNLEGAAKALSGAYGMSIEQARENLKGLVPQFGKGAYIKGGKGGVFGLIGEKPGDEVIMEVDKIRPMIASSLSDALRGLQRQTFIMGMPGIGDLAGALRAAVREVAAAFPDRVEASFALPDGTIQRQVIRLFGGVQSAVRSN